MITQAVTSEMLKEWKAIWLKHKDQLKPNQKSGSEILSYLKSHYVLTEIDDRDIMEAIIHNVTMNQVHAEKLPKGLTPIPKAFYLENIGEGVKFYLPENRDSFTLWGKEVTRMIVGLDITSGYYMVEGSTMLWDELCAFRGLDEKDLDNYVCVANYIQSLERIKKLETTLHDLNHK